MKKTKILIAGTSVYGIENMGDEALLVVLCRELHCNIENLEITWMARHVDQQLAQLYNIQKVIKNFDHDSKELSIGKWFKGLNPDDSGDNLAEIKKSFEECDLLVIGGDPFNEISLGIYRGLAPQAALLITLAKFFNKPVVLYSIHMGRPLTTDTGKELTRYCISNSSLVTLRENFSKDVLSQMNISTENSVVLADSAWGMVPFTDDKNANHILKKEGIDLKSDDIIGINFRHNYWSWDDEIWSKYRSTVASACDYMVEKHNVELLFIPNCTYDLDKKFAYYQDDRPAHREIVQSMKHSKNAYLIESKNNVFDTLSLFKKIKVHFSNRRHSLVFGAIHGTVPVSCGGEWHVKPAMNDIEMGDYFIDIDKLTSELLIEKMEEAWQNKKNLSQKILNHIPELRIKANMHGKTIADFIKEYYDE